MIYFAQNWTVRIHVLLPTTLSLNNKNNWIIRTAGFPGRRVFWSCILILMDRHVGRNICRAVFVVTSWKATVCLIFLFVILVHCNWRDIRVRLSCFSRFYFGTRMCKSFNGIMTFCSICFTWFLQGARLGIRREQVSTMQSCSSFRKICYALRIHDSLFFYSCNVPEIRYLVKYA